MHSKTNDQLADLVNSLKSLFGADPGIMSRSKQKPIFEILWKSFMDLLNINHPFIIKNSALDLLPVFISLGDSYTRQVNKYKNQLEIVITLYCLLQITDQLNESIVQVFPPNTEHLEKGTNE